MKNFLLKIGDFIRGIQRSDERRKKRWLVIFSGTLMIFVIVLWIAYLNVTLPQGGGTETSASTTKMVAPAMTQSENPSFFKTLGVGWEIVWEGIQKNINDLKNTVGDQWLNFKNQLNRTNELNIERPKDGN